MSSKIQPIARQDQRKTNQIDEKLEQLCFKSTMRQWMKELISIMTMTSRMKLW